ncbi:MAG: hypothetical protein AAF389_21225 [Gemmatimonadota bacterium]
MGVRSGGLRGVVLGSLVLVAGCGGSTALAVDDAHHTETVPLAAELESVGGIGGVSVDADGRVVMANFNRFVWRIGAEGDVEVLSDSFQAASGNTVLRDGAILQADFERNEIFQLSDDGTSPVPYSSDGHDGPVGMVEAPSGEVYVANFLGGYIGRVPVGGGPAEVFARSDEMTSPNSVVRHPSGDFFVADLRSPTLFRVSAEGTVTPFVTLPGQANGHLTLAGDVLYVTQLLDHRVMRVGLDGSFAVAAGTGERGFADGPAGAGTVSHPNGIAYDQGSGVVYFNNHRGVMSAGERGDIVLRLLRLGEGGGQEGPSSS